MADVIERKEPSPGSEKENKSKAEEAAAAAKSDQEETSQAGKKATQDSAKGPASNKKNGAKRVRFEGNEKPGPSAPKRNKEKADESAVAPVKEPKAPAAKASKKNQKAATPAAPAATSAAATGPPKGAKKSKESESTPSSSKGTPKSGKKGESAAAAADKGAAASLVATAKVAGSSKGKNVETDLPSSIRGLWHVPPSKIPSTPEYNMMLSRKVMVDKKIDIEVESRLNETPQDAEKQAERETKARKGKNGEWEEDYIVSTMGKPRPGECRKVITKYTGYARCAITYVPVVYTPTTAAFVEFWQRMQVLSLVYERIMSEVGGIRQFNQIYPHRFAPSEKGFGGGGFVENPITMFKNRLRAFEWRKTFQAAQVNQPPIWFEDWTGEAESLPEYEYTHTLLPSKKVKRAIRKRMDEFESVRCKATSKCIKENSTCDSALTTREKQSKHCGCYLIQMGRTSVDKSPFECTDRCECDKTKCGNRVVQQGRTVPVLVLYDRRKGWTGRALTKVKRGQMVGEYTGEVLTSYEALMRNKHNYLLEMPNVMTREEDDEEIRLGTKTGHSLFIIDGCRKGNETRFFSHDCVPNLKLVPTYVERYGGWYARMAFIAVEDIEIGQEFTFDYFPSLKVENARTNYNEMIENCLCGKGDLCKFSPKADKETVENRRKAGKGVYEQIARERAEAAGDSFDEESDSEESIEAKKNLTKKLREERCNRRGNKIVDEKEKEMIERAKEESKKDGGRKRSPVKKAPESRENSPEL